MSSIIARIYLVSKGNIFTLTQRKFSQMKDFRPRKHEKIDLGYQTHDPNIVKLEKTMHKMYEFEEYHDSEKNIEKNIEKKAHQTGTEADKSRVMTLKEQKKDKDELEKVVIEDKSKISLDTSKEKIIISDKSSNRKSSKDFHTVTNAKLYEYNYFPNVNNGYGIRNPPKNVKMHSKYGEHENVYFKEEKQSSNNEKVNLSSYNVKKVDSRKNEKPPKADKELGKNRTDIKQKDSIMQKVTQIIRDAAGKILRI